MTQPSVIHWFRQDLRLLDNPSLFKASELGHVLPIYILDDENPSEDEIMGSASRWWLHYSLHALNKQLDGQLRVFQGNPEQIIEQLFASRDFAAIDWNRCYEPWRVRRDTAIKKKLQSSNIQVNTFNGSLLWEPWQALKADETPYKVFTPFYKKGCLNSVEPRLPLDKPKALTLVQGDFPNQCSIEELKLLPETIRWDKQLEPHWRIGEAGAQAALDDFIKQGLDGYKTQRDFPAEAHVSRLSPHLHWGEISPNTVWYTAKEQGENQDIAHFLSELAWREFSHSLLYYNPTLHRKNLQEKFNNFSWSRSQQNLKSWQQGQTGIPIVDAGMRELWQTGYMHNRVRMIVGSFLVKNLRIHWHQGQAWFWDTLVDADLANNSASWQWIAGCGADAAPYFRIFNPVLQGQKFDPEGEYTRRYVPELAALPNRHLFSPWEAPQTELAKAGIKLGENYPNPIVDLKVSREEALAAFKAL